MQYTSPSSTHACRPCPTPTVLCWQFFSHRHGKPHMQYTRALQGYVCCTRVSQTWKFTGMILTFFAVASGICNKNSECRFCLMLCLKLLITHPSSGTDEVTSQICIAPQFQRIAIATNRVTVWTIVMSHMKLILSQGLTWFLLLPLIMILNTRLEL